jgi:chromosome segregation ATPase
MPCFAGKLEQERAELRELLEMANAQREDFRRAGEHTRMQLDATVTQLNARTREVAQQSHVLQRQERVIRDAEERAVRLEQDLQQSQSALATAESSQQDLRNEVARCAPQHCWHTMPGRHVC